MKSGYQQIPTIWRAERRQPSGYSLNSLKRRLHPAADAAQLARIRDGRSIMAMKIAILEDNLERREVMQTCLVDRFGMYDARFFDDAGDMIRFLDEHLADTLLISLDHDLELKPGPNGRCVDPGTGREVADFLAGKEPVCPVIIHTSNGDAAVGMQLVLRDAQWKTRRVLPFDDTKWILDDWFPAVRRAIVGPISGQQRTAIMKAKS
jgi:hypothetical protein